MLIGVIDDHEDIILLARMAFDGDEVIGWTSGADALADPRLMECDAIILDWAMRTGLSGADVLDALPPGRPPVVVFTAGGFKDEVMAHGPDGFLSKGTSMLDTLVPMVRAYGG